MAQGHGKTKSKVNVPGGGKQKHSHQKKSLGPKKGRELTRSFWRDYILGKYDRFNLFSQLSLTISITKSLIENNFALTLTF